MVRTIPFFELTFARSTSPKEETLTACPARNISSTRSVSIVRERRINSIRVRFSSFPMLNIFQ